MQKLVEWEKMRCAYNGGAWARLSTVSYRAPPRMRTAHSQTTLISTFIETHFGTPHLIRYCKPQTLI